MLLTALALEGLGWVVSQAAGSVVGGAGDRAFSATVRHVRDRLPALASRPEGGDLARGLRRAHLRALEATILDFKKVGRSAWFSDLAGRPPAFFDAALAYCRDSKVQPTASLPSGQTANHSIDPSLLLLQAGAEGAQHSLTSGAGSVEQEVMDDLRLALGDVEIPAGFEKHFRAGGRGRPRFMELFGRYLLEEVKQNVAFRDVLTAGLLVKVTAQGSAVTEMLAGIERRFGDSLARVEAGVDENNVQLAAIAFGQHEHSARLAEILEKLSAEKGVPVAPLRAVLERLGEESVPDDQIPARLAAKAEEYNTLRQQWSQTGVSYPDVDAVRYRALALIETGDLDGARNHFVDARRIIKAARNDRSREEAALLVEEARIDRLQLRYREAAQRYAEAESLIAEFDPEAQFQYLYNRAITLAQLGDEFGENAALADAADLWRRAAILCPRALSPLKWAMTQNNLGNALQLLGQRESGTERLEEAVVAYRAALEEYTRDSAPLDWAMIQNNVGNALQLLGQRESGAERLKEAVVAYRAALEEYTRERVPLSWAMTQNNLGSALQSLGERESGTKRLEEAVVAYRAALEEFTREKVPLHWAAIQNNLGNALRTLGVRGSGTERLEEAVVAYRAALEEYTRERVPLDWAMTQNNLGNALQALWDGESGTRRLEEAVVAYRAALEEHTRERVPLNWAMTQNNLGNVLQLLAQRESGTKRLEEAIVAYRAALEERKQERVPLDWAITQINLGNALQAIGQREGGTGRLTEAVALYHAGLKVFESSGAEYYVGIARAELNAAETSLEQQRSQG